MINISKDIVGGDDMIKFILGKSGFGKTTYIYNKFSELVNSGETKLLMLVPDQSTFETEKAFLDILGAKKSKTVQVFGFSRFCRYVLEQTGNDNKISIDDSTRAVIMSIALEQLNDSLEMFSGGAEKNSVIDIMLHSLKECKKSRISTDALRTAALAIDDKTLKTKLTETALIIDAFDAIVEQSYIDPLDNLTRVYNILLGNNMFEGYTIAIDSFSGFTAQQLDVLRLLFISCKQVYVSLALDPESESSDSVFATANDTYKTLKNIAKSESIPIKPPVKLTKNYRSKCSELEILEQNAYRSAFDNSEKENKNISLFRASDIYSECEYVARKIKELVIEHGYLYSDISVICRDITPYREILNTMFEKYEIPFFMDMSFDIYIKPVIRYVCSIFNIIINGYQKEDVLALLKTGLTQNSEEEISAFENYVYVWNVNSTSFKREFLNNPRGFSENMRESDKKQLQRAEKVRRSIVEPLENFRENIKDKTGREITELLYNLLKDLNVTEELSKMCDRLEQSDELATSAEQVRIWNLLMSVFDNTVAVVGDTKLSPKRYFQLLSIQLSKLTIADIPRTLDSVTVGTAMRVRLTDEKVTFLIGCIDGIFPAVPYTAGVFSPFELKILSLNNIPFGDNPSDIANLETFMAYKSMTSPSERLYASYYVADLSGNSYQPSSIITEINRIFPETITFDDLDLYYPENAVWSLLPAFEECAKSFGGTSPQAMALKKYFSENEKYSDKYSALVRADEAKPFLFEDSQNCKELFGDDLRISASQIEKFSSCRFAYFCNYGLNIREMHKAEINPLEYGTFIHYIMEQFFKKFTKDEFTTMSDDELASECDKILDDYVNGYFGGEENNTPRFMYRFTKIRESVHYLIVHIVNELKHSEFAPVDCELKIGEDIPAYTLKLPTGQNITIRGSIDRVDIMQKNGISYIRIIDYKTGGKLFRLSDILYGINLQMLIYMYSIMLGGEQRYGDITPAGVLYMPMKTPVISADNTTTQEDVKKELFKGLKMNGIILNSFDVLDECDKNYISYNAKKGTLSMGGTLADLEEFGMIFRKLDMTVEQMGNRLYSGDVKASPLKGAKDACEYCPYDSVCAYHRSEDRSTFAKDNDIVCRELKADLERWEENK